MSVNKERKGPLRKIRVIEIANVLAGPFAGSLLADYGADVIKVEMPGDGGDPFRKLLPIVNGESVRWATIARNKRCVTLDLKAKEGQKILLQLIEEADMLVENFRPGTLEKWNLSYDVMKKSNPKLVLCRISGYGQTGPYSAKAGFGTALAAFSGFTALTGFKDRPPVSHALSLADFMGGIFAVLGGLAAVTSILTGNSDEGQVVDVSLYEPLVRLQEGHVTEYSINKQIHERAPMDNSVACPVATLRAKDGKYVVLVASTQNTWERCAMLVGGEAFRDDPRFATNPLRMKHINEVMAVIEPFAAQFDSDEICEKFDKAGVPCCPVIEVDDMAANPQYAARKSIVTVEHERFGKINMPGIFPYFSETPCEIRHCGAAQGEHNDEVYRDEMGFSEEYLRQLKEQGVI